MATRFFVGDSGGTARAVGRFFVGDSGGVARQVKRAFVGDSGGVARLFYQGFTITSPFATWTVVASSDPGTGVLATWFINSNGTISYSTSVADNTVSPGSDSWGAPTTAGIGSSYWARVSVTSGTITSNIDGTSNATSAWTSLSADRSIQKSIAGSGSATVTFTLQIATDSGGSNIVLTSTGNQLICNHSP